MDNLEICKRIAEIEGYSPSECGGMIVVDISPTEQSFPFSLNGGLSLSYHFNPLTDDALCFSLLKKYDIDLISPYRKNGDTKWEAQTFTHDGKGVENMHDESPNKAICLAIIEANNERS